MTDYAEVYRWVHMSKTDEEIRSEVAQVPYVSDLDENGEKKARLRTSDRGWSIYPEGMYFSLATLNGGTEWVMFRSAENECKEAYKRWIFAYELVDFNSLRLAKFNQETFVDFVAKYYTDHAQILPPMINWELVAQDYDGIIIEPDPVYLVDENGNKVRSGRWSHFTHCFDVTTLVVWSNLKVQKLGTSAEFLAEFRCGCCDSCCMTNNE